MSEIASTVAQEMPSQPSPVGQGVLNHGVNDNAVSPASEAPPSHPLLEQAQAELRRALSARKLELEQELREKQKAGKVWAERAPSVSLQGLILYSSTPSPKTNIS
jgi:hypothetical protein